MFDRDTYPSVDALLADAEAALGVRVQVQVDPLHDGFSQTVEPAVGHPFALIRVNERFSDVRHAIAALSAADLIRRSTTNLRASTNPAALAEVQAEVNNRFRATSAEARPKLTQILYDGMARQVTSTIQTLLNHLTVARRCPDLRQQHERFITMLLELNDRYFAPPLPADSGSYPPDLLTANRRLLGVESLGLAAICAGGKAALPTLIGVADQLAATYPNIAEPDNRQQLLFAIPLVEAVLGGDADHLTNKEAVVLAARHAGLREDFVAWIHPNGTEAQPITPILPQDLRGPTEPTSTADADTPYGKAVAEGWKLLSESQWKDAAKIFGRLMDEGGIADQRVLVGRATACLRLDKREEAFRTAKIALNLNASTDLAEEARQIINALSANQVHEHVTVRPDIIAYLSDAIQTYRQTERERAIGIWREAVILGSGGVTLNGSRQYQLKALPGKLLTGIHLTCFTYAGMKLFGNAEMERLMGLPYEREWAIATGNKT